MLFYNDNYDPGLKYFSLIPSMYHKYSSGGLDAEADEKNRQLVDHSLLVDFSQVDKKGLWYKFERKRDPGRTTLSGPTRQVMVQMDRL